jgi:hypothetical protein
MGRVRKSGITTTQSYLTAIVFCSATTAFFTSGHNLELTDSAVIYAMLASDKGFCRAGAPPTKQAGLIFRKAMHTS